MFVDMEYAGHEKGLASTMQHPGGMYGYRAKTFKPLTNSLPKIPRWQAKTAAVVDFVPRGDTPVCIDPKTIRDVTEKFDESDRRLRCELPAGRWKVLRFVAVPTGGRTKHGRPEAMGLECDKMSVAAAELHWKSYTKRIIDRLKSKGIPLAGIVMDSHEAGAQNWTDDMLEEFARRRGYDLRPYLPLMAGYCVAPNAEDVLADFRRTCVELIAERYYGTFDRLCREEGLSFTGQAGGGMFMIADSVFSKKYISIPEGEFWGYQKFGSYDVKDTSSAAHLYGKKVASAEAMTDASYKMTIPELRRRCDLAFAFGANSMTVCAVPHLPKKDCGVKHLNWTFYGTQAYHDRFAARRGDFDFMLRLLDKAVARGLETSVRMPLTRENAAQAGELFNILSGHGAGRITPFVPHAEGRGVLLNPVRLTQSAYESLDARVRDRMNRAHYRTEAEWLSSNDWNEPDKRNLIISLTNDNIDKMETTPFDEIISEIERLDETYYAALPSYEALAAQYGRVNGEEFYSRRDLFAGYQKAYIREHNLTLYDVTDERYSGSRRF